MEVRIASRANGFSLPLHPLQFLVLAITIYFSLIWYGMNVAAFPTSWQPAAYTIFTVILLAHVVSYTMATIINPADDEVIAKPVKGTSATLDRTKHKHAIMDSYCYLCETNVGAKSKHCSVCNKCISDFDHHCLWLNNCVGGKNYRHFITSLVSGLLATAVVTSINLMQFIAYYTDKDRGQILQPYAALRHSQTIPMVTSLSPPSAEFQAFSLPLIDEGFLIITFLTAVLALIAFVLIGHLLLYHIYLAIKGISTYEHIIEKRVNESTMDLFPSDQKKGCCRGCSSKKGRTIAPAPRKSQSSAA